jgi:predicted flap endonuclease-1-like 5' DNA nuclease
VKTRFIFILGLLTGWLIYDLYVQRRRGEGLITPETPSRSAPAVEADPPAPDNLKIIKGIGPVIEGTLNRAGIFTFEELGALTPGDLRLILGKTVERLANEESLLQQARDFARRK